MLLFCGSDDDRRAIDRLQRAARGRAKLAELQHEAERDDRATGRSRCATWRGQAPR
jgi:hypothetical protein